MAVPDAASDTADFRLSGHHIATAVLAIFVKAILALPGLYLIGIFSYAAKNTITAADLPAPIGDIANIVFLLMLPNLVVGFACAFLGFRLAALLLRPSDPRLPALIAASVFIVWAVVSFFVTHAVHVLIAVQLPGTVLGFMWLGVYRGTDRAWHRIEVMVALAVLVAVLANLLVPPLMKQQYFDPTTGAVIAPMKPDARLPTFHRVAPGPSLAAAP
ncbi:MAG TPA: hypothetical protein VKV32_01210 [Stellaceae bacterium]|nr:hypothetical protein [Stellaceae bacterium]